MNAVGTVFTPPRWIFFRSHCVCVFEKNYRLQDIQLSKNFELHTSKFKLEIVVENTGLEPVTSWLQTRRSPS